MTDELSRWQAGYRTRLPYPAESPVIREIAIRLKGADDTEGLSPAQISRLVNTVFWASLATEEGQHAKLSVAIMEPEDPHGSVVLANPFPLSAAALVSLSPIAHARECCIAVSCQANWRLEIWGLASTAPSGHAIVRAKEPGNITIVLDGEILAYLSPVEDLALPVNPSWVMEIAGFLGSGVEERSEMAWFLRYFAEAMQHGRGGTLLVVPASATAWRRSVQGGCPIRTDELKIAWHAERWEAESGKESWDPEQGPVYLDRFLEEATRFRRVVALVGGLTGVDGATVVNDAYEVLGFGMKIRPAEEPPDEVEIAEVLGIAESPETVAFEDIGGTRHQSAVWFVNAHPEAVALVASQDGRITIFRRGQTGIWALRRCETLLPGMYFG